MRWVKKNPGYAGAYYAANRDTLVSKSNEYRRRNLHKVRMARLKQTYGITEERYDYLLDAQNHRCALCGRQAGGHNRSLAVDHDHKNGKVRGLLCIGCNTKLGILEDPRFTYLANMYIEYYKHVHNALDTTLESDPITLMDI